VGGKGKKVFIGGGGGKESHDVSELTDERKAGRRGYSGAHLRNQEGRGWSGKRILFEWNLYRAPPTE